MPAQQFANNFIGNLSEAEITGFLRQLTVKNHLKQNIAEFLPDLIRVARLNRVDQFIALFECVRRNRLVALLEIPGAAVLRVPETTHQGSQIIQVIHSQLADSSDIGHIWQPVQFRKKVGQFRQTRHLNPQPHGRHVAFHIRIGRHGNHVDMLVA